MVVQVRFNTAYGKKHRVKTKIVGLSLTQQNFKDECDINHILKKYQKTGLIEHVKQHQGQYADLSEPTDYQTALNVVIAAQDAFDSLPSTIRKKFNNDPGSFVEFATNPDNIQEMVNLGLAQVKPIEAQPQTVEPAPAQPESIPPQPTS